MSSGGLQVGGLCQLVVLAQGGTATNRATPPSFLKVPVCACLLLSVPVCFCMFLSVPVCSCLLLYVPVCSCMFLSAPVCSRSFRLIPGIWQEILQITFQQIGPDWSPNPLLHVLLYCSVVILYCNVMCDNLITAVVLYVYTTCYYNVSVLGRDERYTVKYSIVFADLQIYQFLTVKKKSGKALYIRAVVCLVVRCNAWLRATTRL